MTYLTVERIADLLDLCREEPLATELTHLVEVLIAHHPKASSLRVELERMTIEAGIPESVAGRYRAAVVSTAELDRLLAAALEDRPEAVLDPEGEMGVDTTSLLEACRSRLRRRHGDSRRLEALVTRLQAVLAADAASCN